MSLPSLDARLGRRRDNIVRRGHCVTLPGNREVMPSERDQTMPLRTHTSTEMALTVLLNGMPVA